MPKLNDRLPSYRRHAKSGQAVVTLNGRDYYLGPHGTKASRREYDRVTAEWLAGGRELSPGVRGAELSVAELVNGFRAHVSEYYRHPDGTPTQEVKSFQYALRLLREVYGDTAASQFGPLALRALQTKMIAKGWCRGVVNQQTRRIRAAFKWASERELIPPSVFHGLLAVSGLKRGRTDARETEPVRPVAESVVEQALQHATPTIAAMVRLQMLTGMRPGEVCSMRTGDIDQSGKVWVYKPAWHKMSYRGLSRTILIGPQAQRALAPYLKPDLQAAVFSPRQSEGERLAALHTARVTPKGQGNEPGTHRQRRPLTAPGNAYSTLSYDQAIRHACNACWPLPDDLKRAKGETTKEWQERLGDRWQAVLDWRREHRWAPNQLRHNFATTVRKQHGLEAAQVLLGHARADVTQVYAERDLTTAMAVIGRVG